MTVIAVFAGLVLIGDALAVLISALVEKISEPASLIVFFGLYTGVFVIAWILAVQITEKFLLRTK